MIPGTTPTHPLFPPDQVFLWLPGLASDRFAFCTRNHVLGSGTAAAQNSEIACCPPFPVSPATFIAWDTQTSPPCPYHPIPVLRPISPAEMNALALRIIQLAGEEEGNYPQPSHILRNEKKCLIIKALAEVGNLCGNVPPPTLTLVPGEWALSIHTSILNNVDLAWWHHRWRKIQGVHATLNLERKIPEAAKLVAEK